MVTFCGLRRLFRKRSILQQIILRQIIQCFGHLLQVKYLRPPDISGSFSFLQFFLNIYQQINWLCLCSRLGFVFRVMLPLPGNNRSQFFLRISLPQTSEPNSILPSRFPERKRIAAPLRFESAFFQKPQQYFPGFWFLL